MYSLKRETSLITNIMKIKSIKNILLSAVATMFVTSCAGTNQTDLTKSVGDAAVDSITKDSSTLTKTAVRNATGYGTDPVESKASGFLNSLTR